MGGAAVVLIRTAALGDAEAIARIQVTAWRTAYRHILPARWLAALDVRERADRWRTRVGAAAHADAPTFVAADEADPDAVLGFVHTGPPRDDDLDPVGRAEVYTVYVDPRAWRQGIGTALLAAVDDFWTGTEVTELTLWAFEANTAARAFYERTGWSPDGARQIDDFGDAQPVEVRYRRPVSRSRTEGSVTIRSSGDRGRGRPRPTGPWPARRR